MNTKIFEHFLQMIEPLKYPLSVKIGDRKSRFNLGFNEK